MVLIIAVGTLYSLFSGNDKKRNSNEIPGKGQSGQIFTGIGRLRLPAAGSQAATVVLSITFPYSAGDRPFSEELASRVSNLRTAAGEYFLSFDIAEIKNKNEDEIKTELLERFNKILRLGKIETLYFHDFMIIE